MSGSAYVTILCLCDKELLDFAAGGFGRLSYNLAGDGYYCITGKHLITHLCRGL